MVTNQQRRAAERRLLQKQLEQRRTREARRKRMVLIASVVATLAIVAVVVVAIVAGTSGGSGKKKPAAGGGSPAASSSTAGQSEQPGAGSGGIPASFMGVTVKNSINLTKEPGVTSKATAAPTKLEYKDLVVGKGAAASPTATVTVQYAGALYKTGTQFDSSWSRGQPATFSLAQVVPGFTQGIGGTSGVPPMKVGGRRIMILPAKLGYGAQAQQSIPANSPLVFVVDLTKIGK